MPPIADCNMERLMLSAPSKLMEVDMPPPILDVKRVLSCNSLAREALYRGSQPGPRLGSFSWPPSLPPPPSSFPALAFSPHVSVAGG